jgi:glutathione S-transferase
MAVSDFTPCLHGDPRSGNAFKVRLLLHLLDRPYTWVPVDVFKGEARTPAFREINPAGKVPVLEVAPGEYLAESNAILHHLAEGTPWLPAGRLATTRMLHWLFFEQNMHEPALAMARALIAFLGRPADEVEVVKLRKAAQRALGIMEQHLAQHDWLAGERATIADIALYAYTHVAGDAGIDLVATPQITAWIARCEALPRWMTLAQAAQ